MELIGSIKNWLSKKFTGSAPSLEDIGRAIGEQNCKLKALAADLLSARGKLDNLLARRQLGESVDVAEASKLASSLEDEFKGTEGIVKALECHLADQAERENQAEIAALEKSVEAQAAARVEGARQIFALLPAMVGPLAAVGHDMAAPDIKQVGRALVGTLSDPQFGDLKLAADTKIRGITAPRKPDALNQAYKLDHLRRHGARERVQRAHAAAQASMEVTHASA